MWATQAAAHNDRIEAYAIVYLLQEQGSPPRPSGKTSPTFPKTRFMYMAGYDDEQKFDAAAPDLITVEGLGLTPSPSLRSAARMTSSPRAETTFALLDGVAAPKGLMLLPRRAPQHG